MTKSKAQSKPRNATSTGKPSTRPKGNRETEDGQGGSTKKRRRNRGSNKRKKAAEELLGGTPQPTNLKKLNALEVDWFGLDNGPSNERHSEERGNVPPALSLAEFLKPDTSNKSKDSANSNNNDTLQQLKTLWTHFCNKRQRKSDSSQSCWQPTPIQLQTWSILTSDELNMIGIAPTGSGKTLSYGAPLAIAAANSSSSKEEVTGNISGIVLVPTRELAQQVARELEIMVNCFQNPQNNNNLRVLACYGGSHQSTKDHVELLRNNNASSKKCRWLISATPGRFLDILQVFQKEKSNSEASSFLWANHIVLDEADRMAQNSDLGEQVSSILKACLSPTSTTLSCFSATYPHKVQEIWKEWMSLGSSSKPCALIRVDAVSMDTSAMPSPKKKQKINPNDSQSNDGEASENEISRDAAKDTTLENATAKEDASSTAAKGGDVESKSPSGSANIDSFSKIPAHLVQTLHVCAEHKKAKKLMTTLDKIRKEEKQHSYRQKRLGIIFFGRIKTLQYISKLLKNQSNHACVELHSQLPQHVRNKSLQVFQAGQVPILLATDIAARGVHVSNVSFVINYDFPGNLEQYIHRCGRCGRNGGQANNSLEMKLPPSIYSFFTRNLAPLAPDLVSLLKTSNAWIDPNLQALVDEKSKKRHGKTSKASASGSFVDPSRQENEMENDGAEDPAFSDKEEDEFAELSGKRIALKRASHVSDASSDSSDDDNESADEKEGKL